MKEDLIKYSYIKTTNPLTNKVERTFEEMTDHQIESILSTANKAFSKWRTTDFEKRSKLLHKVAKIMRERKEELAQLCTLEMGKLHKEALSEIELSSSIYDYYADNGERFLADQPLETPFGRAFNTFEPIGVILSVQPWNFPFYQITRSAAPNIMAGNTIVMKHASNVPQCAAMMEEIFSKAGAPQGVYTNLYISGTKTSVLVANKHVKGVSLTGSAPAGSSIAAEAGRCIKKSTLEMGGSDVFIVLKDADLDKAVQVAAWGRLYNAGQVCTSPKRIIVLDSLAEKFIAAAKAIYETIVVGDPKDISTQLAPLSSEDAVDKVIKQIDDSVAMGAKLVYGGKRLDRSGTFMLPTILTDIKRGMPAYSEEIFGPVLCVFAVKNIEDAISLANDTVYGLGGTVFGTDIDEAISVARQIETGMVYINHVTGIAPELPFGGTKESGYGREQSPAGIYEFVNPKLIRVTTPDAAY